MSPEIYVVGMAAAYAAARDLREFWETVLTRRAGFRASARRWTSTARPGATSAV